MAIVIQKRPYQYCFSGNPVHYELFSDLAASDATVFLEVRLMFRNIGGAYVPSPAIPYNPVVGIATIDAQDLLDGLLEYDLPGFSVDEKDIWAAVRQTGEFYLQYREITATNPDPSWDDSEIDYERFVIKGGISRWKYQGNNFFTNYFNASEPLLPNPFLTWQARERMASLQERMYLLFLNITEVVALTVEAKVTYTDATSSVVDTTLNGGVKSRCYYIPSGAAQWGLDLLNPAKSIHYWEITVKALGGAVTESFRYYADNRWNYNDITLSYRGSLGGLDSIRVRGVIEYGMDYNFSEQATTQSPDYFDGSYFTPQKVIKNSKEQVVYKGDLGFLKKEEQDRLRDIHLVRETWWEVGKKWWPMNIVTKNGKLRTTQDTLFAFPLEFTHAHEGDNYYTPMSVNLGDGVFTSNVCKAMLTPMLVTVDLSGADAVLTIDGTEVDPQNASDRFRYRITRQSDGFIVSDWTEHVYADLPIINIHVGKNDTYLVETQSICTNTIFGKKSSQLVDTNPPAGGGGGGGTPVVNSSILNNTNLQGTYVIRYNAVYQTSGYVGAYNEQDFHLDDAADITVEIILGFSPPYVYLVSNGIQYYPSSNSGGTLIFEHVTVINGFQLNIV
jgi:hypothetical protein